MIRGDFELLRMIRAAGTEMERPRLVGHFCTFPTQESASAAGAEAIAQEEGLESEIYQTNSWVLHLSHSVPLSEDYISRMRPWLADLAERHGGVYTGWDADGDPPKPRGLIGRLRGRRSN